MDDEDGAETPRSRRRRYMELRMRPARSVGSAALWAAWDDYDRMVAFS